MFVNEAGDVVDFVVDGDIEILLCVVFGDLFEGQFHGVRHGGKVKGGVWFFVNGRVVNDRGGHGEREVSGRASVSVA